MSSPYCIWGLCDSNQYCCGDNFCCNESDFNIFFLTFILFGTVALMAMCCACFYCNHRRMYTPVFKKYLQIGYTFMSNEQQPQKARPSVTVNQESVTAEGCIV